MKLNICNKNELQELDSQIGGLIQHYAVDEILVGLRQAPEKLQPFIIAGTTLFAIRYALPPIKRPAMMYGLKWQHLSPILNLVSKYLLADPISFEPPIEDDYHGSTLIPIILRTVGNQFPYGFSVFGQYGRSLLLFRDLPRQIQNQPDVPIFDFDAAFQKTTKVSLTNFIDVGFLAHAAAYSNIGFAGDWFQKARFNNIKLPDDDEIALILDQLAADKWQMKDLYEKYKQPDRRYGAYDFNPLFVFPLVRPWPKRESTSLDEDRLIAPLPELIISRISEGIYRQMVHGYGKIFSDYFGHLFEVYVGKVLSHSVPSSLLLSGYDIRRTYKKGKIPDWVIIDGKTAILIECKTTGLQRKALATADEKAIDYALDEVIDGLIQLYEFQEACQNKSVGLEVLGSCSDFRNLLITYEPFYIVNSVPFKDVIRNRLSEKSPNTTKGFSWRVLVVDDVEILQPHLAAGIDLKNVIDKLGSENFNDVLNEAHQQTGCTYRDSFLHNMDIELYNRLNVPFET